MLLAKREERKGISAAPLIRSNCHVAVKGGDLLCPVRWQATESVDDRGGKPVCRRFPWGPDLDAGEAVMTGTDAPPLAPTWCKRETPLTKADKMNTDGQTIRPSKPIAVSADPVETKQPLTIAVKGCLEVEPKGTKFFKFRAKKKPFPATIYVFCLRQTSPSSS